MVLDQPLLDQKSFQWSVVHSSSCGEVHHVRPCTFGLSPSGPPPALQHVRHRSGLDRTVHEFWSSVSANLGLRLCGFRNFDFHRVFRDCCRVPEPPRSVRESRCFWTSNVLRVSDHQRSPTRQYRTPSATLQKLPHEFHGREVQIQTRQEQSNGVTHLCHRVLFFFSQATSKHCVPLCRL